MPKKPGDTELIKVYDPRGYTRVFSGRGYGWYVPKAEYMDRHPSIITKLKRLIRRFL